MPLYKFSTNDVFRNRVKTHPRTTFLINNGTIVYNSEIPATGRIDVTTARKLKHTPEEPSWIGSVYDYRVST